MHFSCYEKTAEVPLSSSTVPTALYANIRRRDKAVDWRGMLSYRAADANNSVDAGDLAQIPADFRKLFLTPAQTDPGTDTLRISVVLQVSSDDQEREQRSEDNPNVNAHQSSPAPARWARRSICYI
jgi:hypothetical protein